MIIARQRMGKPYQRSSLLFMGRIPRSVKVKSYAFAEIEELNSWAKDDQVQL